VIGRESLKKATFCMVKSGSAPTSTSHQSIKLYLPNSISQINIQKETWKAARTGNSPTKLAMHLGTERQT